MKLNINGKGALGVIVNQLEALEYIEDVVTDMLDGEAGYEPFIDDLGDTKEKLQGILLTIKEAHNHE